MVPKDMYLLSADGKILSVPEPKVYPHKPPKCTDCCSIFMEVYSGSVGNFLGVGNFLVSSK